MCLIDCHRLLHLSHDYISETTIPDCASARDPVVQSCRKPWRKHIVKMVGSVGSFPWNLISEWLFFFMQRKDELLQILLERMLLLPLGSGSSALSTAFKSSVMIFRITVFKVAAGAALPAQKAQNFPVHGLPRQFHQRALGQEAKKNTFQSLAKRSVKEKQFPLKIALVLPSGELT